MAETVQHQLVKRPETLGFTVIPEPKRKLPDTNSSSAIIVRGRSMLHPYIETMGK